MWSERVTAHGKGKSVRDRRATHGGGFFLGPEAVIGSWPAACVVRAWYPSWHRAHDSNRGPDWERM